LSPRGRSKRRRRKQRLGKYGPDNPAEHPGYSDPTGLVDDHFQCATEMATEWRATDIFRPRDGLAMAPHFSVPPAGYGFHSHQVMAGPRPTPEPRLPLSLPELHVRSIRGHVRDPHGQQLPSPHHEVQFVRTSHLRSPSSHLGPVSGRHNAHPLHCGHHSQHHAQHHSIQHRQHHSKQPGRLSPEQLQKPLGVPPIPPITPISTREAMHRMGISLPQKRRLREEIQARHGHYRAKPAPVPQVHAFDAVPRGARAMPYGHTQIIFEVDPVCAQVENMSLIMPSDRTGTFTPHGKSCLLAFEAKCRFGRY